MLIPEKMMPTIEVVSVKLDSAKLASSSILVELSAYNPNPLKIRLKRIEFEVLFSESEENRPLGSGAKDDVTLASKAATSIDTLLDLNHASMVGAAKHLLPGLPGLLKGRSVEAEVRVRGTATIDLRIASPKIPFEERVALSDLIRQR